MAVFQTKDVGLLAYFPLTESASNYDKIYDMKTQNQTDFKSMVFDGISDVITIGTGEIIKTIALRLKANDIVSRKIISFDSGAYTVRTGATGNIVVDGFTSPTVYINGVLGTSIVANVWTHIIVTDV